MAKKTTPEELRKQAQDIIAKAKKLETEENAKIGAMVRGMADSGFNIEYDVLKAKVYELLGIEEKLLTGNQDSLSNTDNKIKGNA